MSINVLNYALAKKDWNKAYEDLSILKNGGRNLIRGTSSEFKEIILPANSWNTAVIERVFVGGDNPLQVGDSAVVRAYIKSGNYATSLLLNFYDASNQRIHQFTPNYIEPNGEGVVQGNFVVPSNTARIDVFLRHRTNEFPADTKYYKELKLEKGNKATDWTPAPEDINAHPFVAELAETVYRSKQNEERIRNLENALTALGGGS